MTKSLRVLYFAALGEALGCREELVNVTEVETVDELRAWLVARAPKWQALQERRVLAAVNQSVASNHHRLEDGDEVAFFPPVTGG